MKKNIATIHKTANTQVKAFQGLFLNRHSKEKIVEQLKRGTLFRLNHKQQAQATPVHNSKAADQLKTWIYDIKLGIQNPSQRESIKNQTVEVKKVRKLPILAKGQCQQKQNKKERRCDKITCFTKKLAKIAAWRQENSHNIYRNIEKLQKSLNLDNSSLSQNDFSKVQGLNYSQDKSLQMSLSELDKSCILSNKSGFNPFSKFPHFSDTVGEWSKAEKKGRRGKRDASVSNKQQNYYIPQFLMSSIMLNSKYTS